MAHRTLLVLTGGAALALAACSTTPAASKATGAVKPAAATRAPAAPGPQAAAPNAAAVAASKVPPAADTAPDAPAYTYQSAGRRDPFLTLVSNEPAHPAASLKPMPIKRGDGVAGLLVSELVVRGVAQTSSKLVALVQGPDGRNYNLHESDKLADGTVKSVTEEGLVINQVVNDPAATVKHREVRKLLRSLEDAKP